MGPMGDFVPAGEPAGDDDRQDGGFPSITRAEQAKRTQEELHEIAQRGGWQPPKTEDLPKADGTTGLPENTSLASEKSLTPGQRSRIEDLSKPSLRIQAGESMKADTAESPDETRITSYAARSAREAFVDENGRHYDADPVYTERAGFSDVSNPVLKELQALNYEDLPVDIDADKLEVQVAEAGRNEKTYKRWLAETIEQHRYSAHRLYQRDPERYSAMSQKEFIDVLSEYTQAEEELSILEEVRISDESAQVRQIERIMSEYGADAGVMEVLEALSQQADIPDMPQHQTFENFIAKVLENKKQAIELAKAKARQMRADMARKYGGDAPAETNAVESPDEADDPHYDGRGYN